MNDIQLKVKHQIDQKVIQGHYVFEKVVCCICNSKDQDIIAQKDRYGLHMFVSICKNCGLIQTNPRMNQKAYNEFYNVEYRKLYEGREGPTVNSFASQYQRGRMIFKYLSQLFVHAPNKYFILEVGCSAGGVCYALKEQGCRVKGVDLDASYVDFGRNQYGLDLSVGSLSDIELDDSPDVIIYSHVMEHILNIPKELKLIKKNIHNNGILYVEVPGVKNIANAYKGDFSLLLQNAHTYHFTLQTLTNLMKINKFKRIAGNEYINAIFTPMTESYDQTEIVSDYEDVMTFLNKMEAVYYSKKMKSLMTL